jgi:hypothetical protein
MSPSPLSSAIPAGFAITASARELLYQTGVGQTAFHQ